MTIEEFIKCQLPGTFINGYEVVSVESIRPWSWEIEYYGSDEGVRFECRVKVPDKRTKDGFRIDTKCFELSDVIT